jgi:hypothetical protein
VNNIQPMFKNTRVSRLHSYNGAGDGVQELVCGSWLGFYAR